MDISFIKDKAKVNGEIILFTFNDHDNIVINKLFLFDLSQKRERFDYLTRKEKWGAIKDGGLKKEVPGMIAGKDVLNVIITKQFTVRGSDGDYEEVMELYEYMNIFDHQVISDYMLKHFLLHVISI